MFIKPVGDKEVLESLRRCAIQWDEGSPLRGTPEWDVLITC